MKSIYHNIPQVGNYFYDNETDNIPAFAVLACNDAKMYWITACNSYEGDKETHHGCQWEANP